MTVDELRDVIEKRFGRIDKAMDRILERLHGNSDVGLCPKVLLLERWAKNRVWMERAVLVALLGVMATMLLKGD